jgi:hypothetical protein
VISFSDTGGRPFRLSEMHDLVGQIATPLLEPSGFECAGVLKWVRSADAPIRQVFMVCRERGLQVYPRWGYSFDFAPHVSGGEPKLRRTAKSAKLETGFAEFGTLGIHYFSGDKSAFLFRAESVIPQAIARAREFWSLIRTVADVPVTYERQRARSKIGRRPRSLAYAFALAINARSAEGEKELAAFMDDATNLKEKARGRLQALFREATEGAAAISVSCLPSSGR